jgi:hypothetical protein
MASIYGDKGLITGIYAWPDPVYTRKPVGIVFEIDGDLSRKATSILSSEDSRQKYREMIHRQYAAPAVREAEDHQRLANWRIVDGVPGSMRPCDVQEDPEDILTRTKAAGKPNKDIPREARIRALERDTVFWEVTVIVEERQKMFSRYRETLGPDQGFEAVEKVPEWFGLKNETVDTKERMN